MYECLVILENPSYYFFAFEQLIVDSYSLSICIFFAFFTPFSLYYSTERLYNVNANDCLHIPPSLIYDNKHFTDYLLQIFHFYIARVYAPSSLL